MGADNSPQSLAGVSPVPAPGAADTTPAGAADTTPAGAADTTPAGAADPPPAGAAGVPGQAPSRPVTDAEYRRLLQLRTGLRRFLHWSEERARQVGVTPTQHQLLLAVAGHPRPESPTVGDLADHLLVVHHSAVQLVDRAVSAGLIARERDGSDRRRVHIRLTPEGTRILQSLSAEHAEELQRLGRTFSQISAGIPAGPSRTR